MIPRTIILVSLLVSLAGCQHNSAETTLDLAGKIWSFSLANSTKKGAMRYPLSIGDLIEISNDTLFVESEYMGWTKTFPIVTDPSTRDTLLYAVTTELISEEELKVNIFVKDSLVKTVVFEPHTPIGEEVDMDELVGKTYVLNAGKADSSRIYFGHDPNLRFGRETKHYFVLNEGDMFEASSNIGRGSHFDSGHGLSYGDFAPTPMRGLLFSFRGSRNSKLFFGTRPFVLRRMAGGELISHYVGEEDRQYKKFMDTLQLVPSVVPAEVNMATLSERLNSGKLKVDTNYPEPDSARAKYAYEDAFLRSGLFFEEISRVEINFNPDGEFFLFAGDRLLAHANWKLSPDRNYLILLGKDGAHLNHLPILSYTEEAVEFRMPLKIRTRKPMGVALTSFVVVNALLRVID